MVKNEEVPQDWKDASIVPLFKKGSRVDCGNYRGISLLSIASKILARILLNRLNTQITPQALPEAQCGFRSGRRTMDMIFSRRQVQEKCLEQNMPLYAVFIDFSKEFDTVSREGLWQVLRKFGCPEKIHKADCSSLQWNASPCINTEMLSENTLLSPQVSNRAASRPQLCFHSTSRLCWKWLLGAPRMQYTDTTQRGSV